MHAFGKNANNDNNDRPGSYKAAAVVKLSLLPAKAHLKPFSGTFVLTEIAFPTLLDSREHQLYTCFIYDAQKMKYEKLHRKV